MDRMAGRPDDIDGHRSRPEIRRVYPYISDAKQHVDSTALNHVVRTGRAQDRTKTGRHFSRPDLVRIAPDTRRLPARIDLHPASRHPRKHRRPTLERLGQALRGHHLLELLIY